MRRVQQVGRAVCLVAVLLLGGIGTCAQAASSPARSSAGLTECLGYYTVALPGEFEYALMSNFSQGLGAWSSEIRLDLLGLQAQELSISHPAAAAEIEALMESRNKEQRREKQTLLERVRKYQTDLQFSKEHDPDGSYRKELLERADRVPFTQSVPSRDAIYFPDKDQLIFHALVNGHILSTELKPQGTPEQTLDAFLSHYKPRALGEVPTGPGVCVPFGVFTGEKQPATVGLNIRLKDQPDIVVFLLARDAAKDEPEDPRKLFDGLTPASTFFGSRQVTPIHRIKPLQAITIDGNDGLGSFVRVTRKTVIDQSRAFNNAAENDEDWGYFAYVPGLSGGKPGDSFNLMFRVERFGRFAKRSMSENEFRELTLRIAASIKRRPGAGIRN